MRISDLPPAAPTSHLPVDSGHVDVVDLVRVVAAGWRILVASIVLSLVAAAGYLYLATPRYEVALSVDRPLPSQIAALNVGRTGAAGLTPFTVDDVFGYFLRRLRSEEAFQKFFSEVYLPSLDPEMRQAPEARLYKQARKTVEVRAPSGKAQDLGLFTIRMRADDPEKTVAWLQKFLGQIEEDARKAFIETTRRDLDVRIGNAERDLRERRLVAETLREDRARQLREALVVAKAISLQDPQFTTARPPSADRVSPFIDGSSLYARGAKSLAAELKVLQEREGDDAFIAGLRDSESQLRMWKSVRETMPVEFSMYRADGDVLAPADPATPKVGLVFALALTVGVASGVLIALGTRNRILRSR